MSRPSHWLPGRLPISFPPIPGEALDSWLESYAWRLHTNSRTLIDHIGLADTTLGRMVQMLRAEELTAIAAATGQNPPTLRAMTLEPFDGIAVTIDRTKRQAQHPPAWRRQKGSRYCPQCLADSGGRWPLVWRLSWTAVCAKHSCLLADYCPRCHRRPWPHRGGNRSDLTPPGVCLLPDTRSGGGAHKPSCSQPLSDNTTPSVASGGYVVAAQRHLDKLITCGSTMPHQRDQVQRELNDLYLLALRGLVSLHNDLDHAPAVVTDILHEITGDQLPALFVQLAAVDAHTIAVGAALAVAATHAGTTGDHLLAWIAGNEQTYTNRAPHVMLNRWKQCGPALLGRILATFDGKLRRHSRLSYGTVTANPRRPTTSQPALARRAASLPALLWPSWSMLLIPTTAAGYTGLTRQRAGLSVLTLIPGTHLSQPQAIKLLGDYTTPGSIRDMLTSQPPGTAEAVIAGLNHLADLLDRHPTRIDYARRRRLFGKAGVSRRAYGRLATSRGWDRLTQGGKPHPLHLLLLDRHLTTLLTGAHPNPKPYNASHTWNPLLTTLPTAVRTFLHDEAQRHLARHGIDEPVTWTPPIPEHLPWTPPGLHPQTLDTGHIAHVIAINATARRPFARIGAGTGLTPMQIQLLSHLANIDMPESTWAALATLPRGDLTRGPILQHLYEQERFTLKELAWLSLQTRGELRQTLAAHGTRLDRYRTPSINIPRQWFEQHYIRSGKSLTQLAKETGYARNTLSKYAQLHGIPIGKPADPFAGWPTPPPASVAAAATIHNGIAHLRRIVATAEHKTQRAAAHALGITEQQLSKSKKTIETATGLTIFKPTSGYLLPTPEGEQFLYHATKALRGIDRRARGWN